VPFCDHRLVEYVFNTPWSMKTFDGREKSLLRAAASDIVPDSILKRVKSPYPATQDVAYEQGLRDALGGLLRQGDAPVLPLLDRGHVEATLRAPAGKPSSTMTRASLEMVLDLNVWLTSDDVALDL
jgi:asparagine synthase (glutamine-hydrolysing)